MPPAAEPPSGCPVVHKKAAPKAEEKPSGGCPVVHKKAPEKPSACPVVHGSEQLDPTNMMPAPNQDAAPGQTAYLSKDRVESTIPRGAAHEGENWVYPSEQMFFNALVRKGKGEGVQEDTMSAVVAIHNNMNENTWREVLKWEELHKSSCDAPKLLRFMGRPDELTLKARLKYSLGLKPRPFDRHDWTVDRCGKHVRYLIDYYDVAQHQGQDRVPSLHEIDAVPSIEVDVRPALDSAGAAVDHLRMRWREGLGLRRALAGLSAPAVPPAAAADDEPPPPPPSAEALAHRAMADTVRERCAEQMAALSTCNGERESRLAHIGLTACIAQQVCRDEFRAFEACRGGGEADAGRRFDEMEECVRRWGRLAAEAAQ
jgi:cytochrome c heme-lyase